MKLERRFYTPLRGPKDSQLILTPETDGETALLDSFFGDDLSNFDNKPISASLHTSDDFKPYIRIINLKHGKT
jgi:hypothetical protein